MTSLLKYKDDLNQFDLIFAMDQSNLKNILDLSTTVQRPKIHLFLEFAGMGKQDVPDPWYGDFSDVEQVYDLLDRSGSKVAQRIVDEYVNKQF